MSWQPLGRAEGHYRDPAWFVGPLRSESIPHDATCRSNQPLQDRTAPKRTHYQSAKDHFCLRDQAQHRKHEAARQSSRLPLSDGRCCPGRVGYQAAARTTGRTQVQTAFPFGTLEEAPFTTSRANRRPKSPTSRQQPAWECKPTVKAQKILPSPPPVASFWSCPIFVAHQLSASGSTAWPGRKRWTTRLV